ncbi:MAG TPA: Xaa-Pro peptidase family protein [Bryobacteraceae bacterium]|nr:Xaa-Pro peptidase family protein [Bryobacteraceae bacterium]
MLIIDRPSDFWENWHLIRLFILLFLAAAFGPAPSQGKVSLDEFRARRAALRQSIAASGAGVLLLKGETEPYDPLFRFVQQPDFYYLTGWQEPGAVLLMTPTDEILFLPGHDARAERYHGRRSSAEDPDVHSVTGFEKVQPIEKLESELDAELAKHSRIYAPWTETYAGQLRARYPFRELADATPLIAQLRLKKSPAEIAAIQHATDVSILAHRAAWKRLAAGEFEYQIAATLVDTFLDQGCEGPAYWPIVGAGPDGPILHYMSNQRRMDRGQVVLIDAAAQCEQYASDITRTVPVDGKFTARQRAVYDVVLGAQKAAIAAVKPGVWLAGQGESLTKIARDYMDAHGKDLQGNPLGNYFTHDIGHAVGLKVHDPPLTGPLEAGMVITIEPGVYIPDEQLGIRIEDVVLVTPDGAKVLSAALPKEPDELEKAVAK